jgi:hypothetical protein
MSNKIESSTSLYNKKFDTKQVKLNTIQIGEVMEVIDNARMGRLKVFLYGSQADKTDASKWKTVLWSSPFAGTTPQSGLVKGKAEIENSYSATQKSYGMWMTPPDVGNLVIVAFINGDQNNGVCLGCLFQPGMNHMLPGIAKGATFGKDAPVVPVAEHNRAGSEVDDLLDLFHTEAGKPVDGVRRAKHEPLYKGLTTQGLENDNIRGLTDSTARRETPSKVFGILTPGGHQFVMDDGSQNYVRLRTVGGSQILLDDSNSTVYVVNSKGTGWVEISQSGKIEMWGADSISVRSEKDINFRADRDINIESGRNINIKTHSTKSTTPETQPKSTVDLDDVLGTLHIDVAGEIKLKAGEDISTTTAKNTNVYSGEDLKLTQVGSSNINSGVSHKETANNGAGRIDMNSAGQVALKTTAISGISLKVDSEGNLLYTNILETRSGSALNSPRHTETKRGSILTRFPTREPYPDHESKNLANQS